MVDGGAVPSLLFGGLNLFYAAVFVAAIHLDRRQQYAHNRRSSTGGGNADTKGGGQHVGAPGAASQNGAHATEAHPTTGSSSSSFTFPQYCQRAGLALSGLGLLLAVDPFATRVYPVAMLPTLSMLINSCFFAIAGFWVWFHASAFKRQMNEPPLSDTYRRVVTLVGPAIYCCTSSLGVALVFATNRMLFSVLIDGSTTLGTWTYVGVGVSAYVNLRASLQTFLDSGARVGAMSMDVSHITSALRRMSLFFGAYFFLPLLFSISTLLSSFTAVTSRAEDPAPDSPTSAEAVYGALLMFEILVGVICWYVWPFVTRVRARVVPVGPAVGVPPASKKTADPVSAITVGSGVARTTGLRKEPPNATPLTGGQSPDGDGTPQGPVTVVRAAASPPQHSLQLDRASTNGFSRHNTEAGAAAGGGGGGGHGINLSLSPTHATMAGRHAQGNGRHSPIHSTGGRHSPVNGVATAVAVDVKSNADTLSPLHAMAVRKTSGSGAEPSSPPAATGRTEMVAPSAGLV